MPEFMRCAWLIGAEAYPFPLEKSLLPNGEALLGAGKGLGLRFVHPNTTS